MGGVRIAVEQFDGFVGRRVDNSVVHLVVHRHRAHGLGSVGEGLGHSHDIRCDAETVRGEGLAGPAESADHLVEHQQDAVFIADLPQTFEITFGGHQATA
ncbi:MAG: hypothetical protein MAG794_00786 [Gammaproteobacteria bacterium]|nr:hypothetical protein [Gammaproteobacteria bacterium]